MTITTKSVNLTDNTFTLSNGKVMKVFAKFVHASGVLMISKNVKVDYITHDVLGRAFDTPVTETWVSLTTRSARENFVHMVNRSYE